MLELASKGRMSPSTTPLSECPRKTTQSFFLQRFKPPVLIDEIQKAPELLPYIKILVDNSDDTGAFRLTGSQPLHLMKEVSESLAGRAVVVEMLGLSNAEIGEYRSQPFSPSPSFFVRRVGEAAPFDVKRPFSESRRAPCRESGRCPKRCAQPVTNLTWRRTPCATYVTSHTSPTK